MVPQPCLVRFIQLLGGEPILLPSRLQVSIRPLSAHRGCQGIKDHKDHAIRVTVREDWR
jgi:hypothetical protein